jgi:hypothetical protein
MADTASRHSSAPNRRHNRIAHDYLTVDDDVIWTVVEHHAAQLRRALGAEITTARSALRADEPNA